MAEEVKKVQRIKLPNLKRSREAKELSQPQLSKKAHVSHYQVAVAELGSAIQLPVAQKIASALGIQLQSLRG